MVVLQALSEYLANTPSNEVTLDVDVKLAGRQDINYHFNNDNAYTARSSRVSDVTSLCDKILKDYFNPLFSKNGIC